MAELAYGEVYAMNTVEARKRLVRDYLHPRDDTPMAYVASGGAPMGAALSDRRGEWAGRSLAPSAHRTAPEQEQAVLQAHAATGLGQRRLALYRQAHGIIFSPHTIRHILRRHGRRAQRVRRRSVYPAQWAWEVAAPLGLIQVDVKDIHDKGSLGTQPTTHLRRQHLPRYQWTACDGRTRLRFLAFSHTRNSPNGLAFLTLVLAWLRLWEVETRVTFQGGWGQEFGGDNPQRVEELSQRFLAPWGGALRRYLVGRKGYSGRVERRHRTELGVHGGCADRALPAGAAGCDQRRLASCL